MAKLTEKQIRARLVACAEWGVKNEPSIHYTETAQRDDWLAQPQRKLPLYTDCSGFVTYCYRDAGQPDPNGLAYKYLGYTGTQLTHCAHIPISQVQPGDLAVYGTDVVKTGHHVGIVVEVKSHTLAGIVTVSHGGERGPLHITCAEEMQYQPAGIVFLRPPLGPHAPAQPAPKKVPRKRPGNPQPAWYTQALRAKPYWGWLIWREHGAPRALRPAQVPRLVPPVWWVRYAARRRRGAAA